MIKLLLVALVIGLATAFMLRDKQFEDTPGELYIKELDRARGLEQQMLEDVDKRMEQAGKLSQ